MTLPSGDYPPVDPERLHGYKLPEIDRGADDITFAAYAAVDGKGPVGILADLCLTSGRKVVLDAGCGTGRQLHDTIAAVRRWYGRSTEDVVGHGISNFDFRGLSRDAEVNQAYRELGPLAYFVADLATQDVRQELYNLIYSHEVLRHSDEPGVIVENLWKGLAPGGVLYFNALPSQQHALTYVFQRIGRQEGQIRGRLIKSVALESLVRASADDDHLEDRVYYAVTKPDHYGWLDPLVRQPMS
jgi:SAM-dependent methyltransferase